MTDIKTVDEAVNKLYSEMSDYDKQYWKELPKGELISFHSGLGRAIRNEYGLWLPESALLKDTGKIHPDDASQKIIETLWEKIQND